MQILAVMIKCQCRRSNFSLIFLHFKLFSTMSVFYFNNQRKLKKKEILLTKYYNELSSLLLTEVFYKSQRNYVGMLHRKSPVLLEFLPVSQLFMYPLVKVFFCTDSEWTSLTATSLEYLEAPFVLKMRFIFLTHSL